MGKKRKPRKEKETLGYLEELPVDVLEAVLTILKSRVKTNMAEPC